MQLKPVKLTMGIILETVTVSPEGAFAMKNQNKTHIFQLAPHPWVPKGGLQIENNPQKITFEYGVRPCIFKATRSKKPTKKAVFDDTWLFLRDFWLLAALKQHGRTPNLENRILHENPNL